MVFAATLAIFLAWSSHFVGGRVSNDQLFNIATGIDLRATREPIFSFYREAIDACADDAACVKNQVVLLSEMPFNYPIAAATGLWLARAGIPDNFALFAFTATGISLTIGFATAIALFVIGASSFTNGERFIFAGYLLLALALLLLRPERALPFNLMMLNRPTTVAALLGLFVAAPCAALLSLPRVPQQMIPAAEVAALAVAVTCAVVARLQILPAISAVAGAAILVALVLRLTREAMNPFVAAVVALAALLVLSSGSFLEPLTNAVPRANGFLAIMPALALLMLRPNSLFVLFIPVIAVFHLSSAALIAAVICAGEIWLALWGAGSLLLILTSALTAGLLLTYTRLTFIGLTEGFPSVADLVPQLMGAQFTAALAIASILALAGAYLARHMERFRGTARSLVQIAGLFLLHQIGGHLGGTSMFDSGMYVLTRAFIYCAPPLVTAAVFVILIEAARLREPSSPSSSRGLVCGGMMLVTLWSVPAGPDYRSLLQGAAVAWHSFRDPATTNDPALSQVKYRDPVYWMRTGPNAATDPLKFLSYTKLRFRLWEDPKGAEHLEFRRIGSL